MMLWRSRRRPHVKIEVVYWTMEKELVFFSQLNDKMLLTCKKNKDAPLTMDGRCWLRQQVRYLLTIIHKIKIKAEAFQTVIQVWTQTRGNDGNKWTEMKMNRVSLMISVSCACGHISKKHSCISPWQYDQTSIILSWSISTNLQNGWQPTDK